MREVSAPFRTRPFHRDAFLAAGYSEKVLRGKRFRRLLPGVWVWHDHEMTEADHVLAARLALPERARLTGVSAIRRLGLDIGAAQPAHFVIAGDHHLELEDVVLHRTDRMPPAGDEDVHPVAAFVEYCRWASVLDAICVGDWLLFNGHMTPVQLRELVHVEQWREGSAQARWVCGLLDERSRSLPESRCRAYLIFAGLPWPESNVEIMVDGRVAAIVDLALLRWNCVVEYEGSQHQEQRGQYLRDVDRYALLRRRGLDYVQITKESAKAPMKVVTEVYRMLARNGFDGPAPDFGATWRLLHRPIPRAVPPLARPAFRDPSLRQAAVTQRPFRPTAGPQTDANPPLLARPAGNGR